MATLIQPSARFFYLNFPRINGGMNLLEVVKILDALTDGMNEAERRDTCTDPEFGSKEWFEQIPEEEF